MVSAGGNYHVVSRWPNAFALSTSLHVGIVAAALWLGYAAVEPARPVVMHLVSFGQSAALRDEPAATAPVVAVKLRPLPPPVSLPEPTAQSELAPQRSPARHPVNHAPVAPTATTHASPSASSRSERISIDRFRQLHPTGATAPRATPVGKPVPRIQGDRIANDLRAGITTSTGATGAESGVNTSDYVQRLEAALGAALERIPGFDDGLHAEVEFHILADGRLTGARLVHRSVDERFDAAIVETVDDFNAGPRPADVPELHRTEFTTRVR
jgi:TonB family protein